MRNYVESTHIKNYYENGRVEPWILVESPTEKSYINYASSYISSAVCKYDGTIPDSRETELFVWHLSNSVETPIDLIPTEYEKIDFIDDSIRGGDRKLSEQVKNWDGYESNEDYKKNRAKFFVNTQDEIQPFCSTLLTCECGYRQTFPSVSMAIGKKYLHHEKSECSDANIWYLCGMITPSIREKSLKKYEGFVARGGLNILKIIDPRNKDKKPINKVPIHNTPFSIALQDIGAYNISEYSNLDTDPN